MNSETNSANQTIEIHSIDDIDANGYLVNKVHSINETGDTSAYLDKNVDFENEGERPDDDSLNIECNEDEKRLDDEKIMGKVFNTLDDAYTFYNRYAFVNGFGIRILWGYKNTTTNEVYRKVYVCNKQGFKKANGGNVGRDSTKRRRDSRTGCEAKLRVSKTKDTKWRVDVFNNTHNNELTTTPTKVMKHRSHGKVHRTMACKSLMSRLSRSGLRPCQIKKTVNAMKSPHEPDVTSKQCVDILSNERKQYRGKEFYGLIKHLQEKSRSNINHYFQIELCDDGSRNIFWADGRSRDAYVKFGNVVVFYVTYMTNRFKMPFAPIVGVNHHGQSILFSGALLENEKEESFQWLFEQFLKCMFNKHPVAIITDQDKAIGNAISKVFPCTRHRFCAWHISKHEVEHLRPFAARFSDFQECYRKWKKSNTIAEFEAQWEVIRDKYSLESSSWMVDMYNQREHWVKAFFKDVFLAGMTTSGRSESIHSYIDNYVNSRTILNEFVVQYDKAVDCRRAAKEDEDFQTMNTRPVLSSVHPIEEKAGRVYTRKIFERFQEEWKEATKNLTHETLSKNADRYNYLIGQVNVDKKYWRVVNFHFGDKVDATCSCAKFETYGILCKHILYVMKKKHVETLPDHYILSRWTLDARYKVGNNSIGIEERNTESGVSSITLWCVHGNYTKAIEQAKDSPSEVKRLNNFLVKFIEEQTTRKKTTMVETTYEDSCVGTSQVNLTSQISVRDPLVPTSTKGRPKSATRIKSSLEMKKKKTCSYCKDLGHYITGCPKKKAEDASWKKE